MIEDVVAQELQASFGKSWWFAPLASAASADKSVALDTYEAWQLCVRAGRRVGGQRQPQGTGFLAAA